MDTKHDLKKKKNIHTSVLDGDFCHFLLWSLSCKFTNKKKSIFLASSDILVEMVCSDENPLLEMFQLHVLSLEVLREAVYPSCFRILVKLKLAYILLLL